MSRLVASREIQEFYDNCLKLLEYYESCYIMEEDPLAVIMWKNLMEYWRTGVSKSIAFTAI